MKLPFSPFFPFLLFFLLISQAWAQGTDVFVFVVQKEQKKKQSRWSLGEWMATKNKIALMDQWLALHSSSNFFEGVIGGQRGNYTLDLSPNPDSLPQGKHTLTSGELLLYFSILGLEGKYEDSDEGWNGHSMGLGLRLIGNAVQGTHLTFNGGIRHFNENGTFDNTYLGGTLSLYLFSFFGVEGVYRSYLAKKAKESDDKLKGTSLSAGFFIDISFFRIFAQYNNDVLTTESDGTFTEKTRKGPSFGLKIFF